MIRAWTFLAAIISISADLFSQVTVNPPQLNFGSVYENAPDSLSLTLKNNFSYDVSVTGVRFYDTYGVPAFSTSIAFVVIPSGDSVSIWIRFSPRHNIFHNSEMVIENDGLRGFPSVDLVGQGKYSNHYYDATENLAEENLKNAIGTITGNGYNSLGYNIARDSMFMRIDNKKINGQGAAQNTIECVYTGREAIGYADRPDCQTNFSFNTEHTFPQSFFTSLEPMKSDLHHLFPTDDAANNERDNNPFAVVTSPTWNNGGSLSNGTTFEPRDSQKGRTARALFYFVLRYQNYSNFVTSQETTLRNWHGLFQPDAIERRRNDDIFSVQNNRNPFVDYPVFIERINSITSFSTAPVQNSIDLTQDTINFGMVQSGSPADYNYVIVNDGNTSIQFSNFALSHAPELTFAIPANDTTLSPGESLAILVHCDVTNTDSILAYLTFETDDPTHLSVTIPVSVNDMATGISTVENDIVISPNPANEWIRISAPDHSGEISYQLFDVAGMRIFSSSFNGETNLDVAALSPGIYILNLSAGNRSLHKKIVVQ